MHRVGMRCVMNACLYAGGAPLNEVGQLAFPDALQALVHLSRVYLTLHDEVACQNEATRLYA